MKFVASEMMCVCLFASSSFVIMEGAGIGKYQRKAARTRALKRPKEDKDDGIPSWKRALEGQLKRAEASLGAEALSAIQAQYQAAVGNTGVQDGIIQGLLAQRKLVDGQVRAIFNVGQQRIDRIRTAHPDLPQIVTRYSSEQIEEAKRYILAIKAEVGFACAHRAQREYIEAGSFLEQHRLYSAETQFPISWERFYVLLTSARPLLRTSRLRQDMCSVCMSLETRMRDPAISMEEREELMAQKTAHYDDAMRQRHAMNEYVRQALQAQGVQCQEVDLPCLPDVMDDVEAPHVHLIPAADERGHQTIVQCEDFGQGIPLPYYQQTRPGIDFFTSNLIINEFIIANLSQRHGTVFLFDERDAGKSGDAMCTLRWKYLTAMMADVVENGRPLPTVLVKVLDNCTAQNKSNVSAKFDAVISLLLIPKVTCLYLKPGHSHMRADAIVSQSKHLLRGKNWFSVQEMAQRMSTGHNLTASVVTEFNDWTSVLDKHFSHLPTGFTKTYKWEFDGGNAELFQNADAQQPTWRMEWASNARCLRTALLHDIFRLPLTATVGDIIVTRPVLQVLQKIPLAETKVKSLTMKYETIPVEYQDYFPRIEQEVQGAEDQAPVEPEAQPAEQPAPLPRRRVGRPPEVKPIPKGTRSLMQMWSH